MALTLIFKGLLHYGDTGIGKTMVYTCSSHILHFHITQMGVIWGAAWFSTARVSSDNLAFDFKFGDSNAHYVEVNSREPKNKLCP